MQQHISKSTYKSTKSRKQVYTHTLKHTHTHTLTYAHIYSESHVIQTGSWMDGEEQNSTEDVV